METQIALTLWHIVLGIITLVGAFIGWDRHFNAPLRKWRGEQDVKVALMQQQLETGSKRMDALKEKDDKVLAAVQTLTEAVTGLKIAVAEMKGAFQNSVFKGIGEEK